MARWAFRFSVLRADCDADVRTVGLLRSQRSLWRLAAAPAWAAPAVVMLGLAAAIFEGVGLSLLIPLVQMFGSDKPDGSILGKAFEALFSAVPAAWRMTAIVAGLCAAILLKNAVALVNTYVTQWVSGRVAHRIRVEVLRQLISSCIDYRVETRRSDVVTTIANNSWSVASALTLSYRMIVSATAVFVFVALMLAVSPMLTLVAVLCFTVIGAGIAFATRSAHRIGEQVVAENKAFGLRMWETVVNLRLIRSCVREADELKRFEEASESVRRRLLQMTWLWSLPAPLSEVLAIAAIALVVAAGYMLGLSVAALAAFLALLYRMQGPVRELFSIRVALDGSAAAVADVARFLQTTREPYLADGGAVFEGLKEGVALKNVSYRYEDSDSEALRGVSFDIPRGTLTAIVGRSGAGKSTLVDLLFRFRDPTGGQILVDGVPLRDLRLASWRRRVAVMSQDVQLLNDTVASNIGFGRAEATRLDIERAAELAGASAFIAQLPQSYDTLIGDAGARLSGGQRQRIALARTVLRDPDLLLLDEATNALDNETEREFQLALRRYAQGRTVVVIAHRLSTVEEADQVIVLDDGRLVESGPPAVLLKARGAFARLHGLQTNMAPAQAA